MSVKKYLARWSSLTMAHSDKPGNFLGRLLDRGDKVTMCNGRLRIEPSSGKQVPEHFIVDYGPQLIIEALRKIGIDGLVYASYSTGRYGKLRSGGVTLQFERLISDGEAYVIFNVEMNRTRSGKGGKRGSPLPDGRFVPGKRSAFIKFWQATGLTMPPRLASFYDYMGNLKGVVFAETYTEGDRLTASALRPLSVSHTELLEAFDIAKLPYSSHTTPRQGPYSSHTRMPYKETAEPLAEQGVQPDSTAAGINYGIRLKGSTGTREALPSNNVSLAMEDQSNAQWLEEYGVDEIS